MSPSSPEVGKTFDRRTRLVCPAYLKRGGRRISARLNIAADVIIQNHILAGYGFLLCPVAAVEYSCCSS